MDMTFYNRIFFILLLISSSLLGQVKPERQWPSYRGYLSSGWLDAGSVGAVHRWQ
jgi:hypothetical protein